MSDFMGMSDADFMANGPSKLAEIETAAAAEAQNADTNHPAEVPGAEAVVEVPAADATPQEHEETETPGEGGEHAQSEALGNDLDADGQVVAETGEVVQPADKPAATAEVVETSAAGLPDGAERIFATFRANGRDMQVKSVDEAIRLMQMGANYSQKQAGHKKNAAYVKVLEQNGLLDHEKLSFAVDLLAGKPEAIGKLLKDTKVDVHDLDDDKVAAYRAVSRAPSKATLDLDSVVSEIEDSPHFNRLVGDMKSWDQESQALLGNHPESLRQLNEQIGNGVYDKIMDEVNRQQVLGTLIGVPIMQAYNQIGQSMAAAGAFNAPAPKGPVKKLVTPGKKPSATPAVAEDRRRAAAPSKGVSTATTETTNPKFLNMSDAEFLKQSQR